MYKTTADKQESTGTQPSCRADYAVLLQTIIVRCRMQILFHKVEENSDPGVGHPPVHTCGEGDYT